MRLDYAKELVSVTCERLVEVLAATAGGTNGTDGLNDVERACWDELRRAALRGMEVFRGASDAALEGKECSGK